MTPSETMEIEVMRFVNRKPVKNPNNPMESQKRGIVPNKSKTSLSVARMEALTKTFFLIFESSLGFIRAVETRVAA